MKIEGGKVKDSSIAAVDEGESGYDRSLICRHPQSTLIIVLDAPHRLLLDSHQALDRAAIKSPA